MCGAASHHHRAHGACVADVTDGGCGPARARGRLPQLQMFGYEMSWASFNVIEVMSSTRFSHKRLAYLVAAQSFSPETDVLMLATNLIKKDIGSSNHLEAAIALNGLSNFVNTDLARDLSADVVGMLNHSRPYIRKRVRRHPSAGDREGGGHLESLLSRSSHQSGPRGGEGMRVHLVSRS